MKIGQMNERILIQHTVIKEDEIGNRWNAWEDYYSCAAYASTYQADEEESETTREQRSVTFTIRWSSETAIITSANFRVFFRGEAYDITAVDLMNYGKKSIKLSCRREERSGHE